MAKTIYMNCPKCGRSEYYLSPGILVMRSQCTCDERTPETELRRSHYPDRIELDDD